MREIPARWQGRIRRRRGDYDKRTLACFFAVARATGRPEDFLAYALFRRDLGLPLPARWLPRLVAALPVCPAGQRTLALGLIAERQPSLLDDLPERWLTDSRLPAVLAHLPSAGGRLVAIDTRQAAWRAAFGERLRGAAIGGGIAVVGNAATLHGSGAGPQIDRAALVCRFNQCHGAAVTVADVGVRTDIWVVAPGYRGPCPDGVSWVVMSGPDMRYRLGDWRQVMPLVEQGIPLLTVPLASWRELVAVLRAPPSAGVLFLAYLKSILGASWNGVAMAGIGCGLDLAGRYHAALPAHRPSGRHAWVAEATLVAEWRQAGLESYYR